MKKIISILIILIILIVVGMGSYWYFDKEQRGPDGGSLSIGDFFPFGREADIPAENINGTPEQPTENLPAQLGRLWKIAPNHQAGAGLLDRDGEAFVRFIDTATGNVFENKIGEVGLKRISNTTIPKIKEAVWLPTGDSVIARYSNDAGTIQTLHAKILPPKTLEEISAENSGVESETTPETTGATGEISNFQDVVDLQELEGTLLSPNIIAFSLFAPKDKAFYIIKNSSGGSAGYTSLADGSKPLKIFDSPLSEWIISWPKESTAVITTKPSALSPGYSYLVNSTTGSFQKLMGNINGLSVNLSGDVKHAIYSYSESNGNAIALAVFDIENGKSTTLVRTFAEKCLWLKDNINVICAIPSTFPRGTYPDSWYEGSISFSDDLWSINTLDRQVNKVADLKSLSGEEIDVIKPIISSKENILIFTNKKDSTLWAFRLNETTSADETNTAEQDEQ